MNMQKLMQEAQKMQAQLQRDQKELESTVYEGNSSLVKVKMNGRYEVMDVKIENIEEFSYKIKIDHHPFEEKFCDLELIDDTCSSTCEMIIELCNNSKLKLSKNAAEKLYMGIVADTNRFMYSYTSSKTFNLCAKLLEDYNIDIIA